MPKHDFSFADVKRAANSSVPVVPVGSSRDRIGMAVAGNFDVLAEAADREPSGGLKSGPAWAEGVRNGTQVSHRAGKNDLDQLGRRRVITY
jgi:hypothetical protein